MEEKYDGWIVKERWGSLLLSTIAYTEGQVIANIGYGKWEEWRRQGCKIVKVKLIEVKDDEKKGQ